MRKEIVSLYGSDFEQADMQSVDDDATSLVAGAALDNDDLMIENIIPGNPNDAQIFMWDGDLGVDNAAGAAVAAVAAAAAAGAAYGDPSGAFRPPESFVPTPALREATLLGGNSSSDLVPASSAPLTTSESGGLSLTTARTAPALLESISASSESSGHNSNFLSGERQSKALSHHAEPQRAASPASDDASEKSNLEDESESSKTDQKTPTFNLSCVERSNSSDALRELEAPVPYGSFIAEPAAQVYNSMSRKSFPSMTKTLVLFRLWQGAGPEDFTVSLFKQDTSLEEITLDNKKKKMTNKKNKEANGQEASTPSFGELLQCWSPRAVRGKSGSLGPETKIRGRGRLVPYTACRSAFRDGFVLLSFVASIPFNVTSIRMVIRPKRGLSRECADFKPIVSSPIRFRAKLRSNWLSNGDRENLVIRRMQSHQRNLEDLKKWFFSSTFPCGKPQSLHAIRNGVSDVREEVEISESQHNQSRPTPPIEDASARNTVFAEKLACELASIMPAGTVDIKEVQEALNRAALQVNGF
ncbi:Hypothetical Protein FCC1311_080092 [Hondaea fermentalgiana]|uniref:Uncharacterized protein n=1 Tax=Hondaea fermentalgiana TaxID=2315210 RepID=A0A2R5GV44_9STRA|nr:Hypothetical Protein FCC1311_080092 [Hondaea fermentalgiana]|eukprot:GBG31784.1 Hypothetical Protein FCC1311_080092 [Hondaea fermentalgiana]